MLCLSFQNASEAILLRWIGALSGEGFDVQIKLQHDNIMSVSDYVTTFGTEFIVMPYLSGMRDAFDLYESHTWIDEDTPQLPEVITQFLRSIDQRDIFNQLMI